MNRVGRVGKAARGHRCKPKARLGKVGQGYKEEKCIQGTGRSTREGMYLRQDKSCKERKCIQYLVLISWRSIIFENSFYTFQIRDSLGVMRE